MTIRSTTLGYGRLSAGGFTNLFTVPAGHTVLVKSWYGLAYGTVAANARFVIRFAGVDDIIVWVTTPVSGPYRWDGWLALRPSYKLDVVNSTNGILTYLVSGTLLEGVAPEVGLGKPV